MWTLGALPPAVALVVAAESTDQPLLQYGAVGILAAFALLAVRVLFMREVAAHDRERERADRLEAQLQHQNELIQERFVTTLQQAAQAIQEAMAVMRARQ